MLAYESEISRSWGFPKPIKCKCSHQYIAFRYKVFVTAQLFGDERCLKSSSIAIEIRFKNCVHGQSVMISLEPVELYGTFWRNISLRCSSLQWQLVKSKIHINQNRGVGKELVHKGYIVLSNRHEKPLLLGGGISKFFVVVRPQVGKYSGEVKESGKRKGIQKAFKSVNRNGGK